MGKCQSGTKEKLVKWACRETFVDEFINRLPEVKFQARKSSRKERLLMCRGRLIADS